MLDETFTSLDAGSYNTFSNGGAIVCQYGAAQAYYLSPSIYKAWLANGGWTGGGYQFQGFPTSDTQTFGNVQISYFQDEKIIAQPNGQTRVVPTETSMTFTTNVTNSAGFSGSISLTVNQNGYYNFSWNLQGNLSSAYDIVLALVSPSGTVYTFAQAEGGNIYSDTGVNASLSANWADLEGATVYAGTGIKTSSAQTENGFLNSTTNQVVQGIPNVRSVVSVVSQPWAGL